jgi:hypothetical protein
MVAVAVADLLNQDLAVLSRMKVDGYAVSCGASQRSPYKLVIRSQGRSPALCSAVVGLLCKELLGMLIEIGWQPGIDEKRGYFLGCKIRALARRIQPVAESLASAHHVAPSPGQTADL